MLARFAGSGYLVFGVVMAAQLRLTAAATHTWFNPVGVAMFFGPGMALLVAGLLRSTTWVSRCALACAVGYLGATGCWFLAWKGGTVNYEIVTWLTSITALPPVVLVLAHPVVDAFAFLALATGLRIGVLYVGHDSVLTRQIVVDSLNVAVFGAIAVAAFALVLRSGRILDETRAQAIAAVSASAASAARDAERSRIDGLVHDRVIAALTAASDEAPDARLPDQAATALSALDRLMWPDDASPPLSVAHLCGRLRAVAGVVCEQTMVSTSTDSSDQRLIPAEVGDAIAEAVGEALRNSVRHAGRVGFRGVRVRADSRQIQVTVLDDGDGFEPSAVASDRLGLRVSVAARLSGVGGSGSVRSAPGAGTLVELRWPAR